jgi:hypothetical protein
MSRCLASVGRCVSVGDRLFLRDRDRDVLGRAVSLTSALHASGVEQEPKELAIARGEFQAKGRAANKPQTLQEAIDHLPPAKQADLAHITSQQASLTP